MRQKFITALSLVILFTVVFSAQLASTAVADTKNGNPVTSPVTFFQISGKITYKFLKFFGTPHHDTAAANVKVTAENVFTNDEYQTTTDSNGNYILNVEEKGVYLVSPSGGNSSTYVPAIRAVHANKAGAKTGVNFQGYIFP